MELLRKCFQDIVKEFQNNPWQQIAVNCTGYKYSNKIDLGYGKKYE